ncbi:MAG: ABC transporter substrate-binding protein [Paenibacillaceae bacterium]
MKKRINSSSLLIIIMLVVSLVLAGCTSNNNTSNNENAPSNTNAPKDTAEVTPEPEKLEKVTLIGYLLGEAPPDGPAIMAEVNKKLEADINATIELKYIPFADIATKYPLMLTTGQDWDFIFGNVDYASNAAKGGYQEITLADVEKNMPLTFKATSESMWADTLVNGNIYMIPQTFKELGVGAHFYRDDLRKKYNLPEIKTLEDFEAYFEAVKANETDILPVDGTAENVSVLFGKSLGDWSFSKQGLSNLVNFNPDDPNYQFKGLFDADFLELYREGANTAKRLHDEGLLPKNPFAQKTTSSDLIKAGKSAITTNAFEQFPQFAADFSSKGWEVGVLPAVTSKGTALQRPASGNGISFSPNGKNYERAMMAIDLLHQDPSYNMLISFGIEGKNYVINADGKLALGPDIDPAKNPYPMYGAGWWSNNRDQWPPLENYTQAYIDMKKELQANAKSYLLDGFNPNTESFKSELANVTNVMTQYELPIRLGIVKTDVDSAIKELLEKLEAAGAQKVVDEIKKQAAQYVKDHTLQ